jgi:hypothetical protein
MVSLRSAADQATRLRPMRSTGNACFADATRRAMSQREVKISGIEDRRR